MIKADYVVVGSGLTGAVIARGLFDSGRDVVVVDRRDHIGGNVHDRFHLSGIRIHTYGPHYFRTSCERVWEWANRFSEFYRYEASLLADIGDDLVQWPLSSQYISEKIGEKWSPSFQGEPTNLEEAALSLMPRRIFETFVKEYNEKQWGVDCKSLSAELCKRFDVRADGDSRLKPLAKHQGIPVGGYATWTSNIFSGIPVILNFDYLKRREEVFASKKLVFTGPIDEFFDFDIGRLQYRGQKRKHQYHGDLDFFQRKGQINNPLHSGGPHIRTLEWKHMLQCDVANNIRGTVVTTETPYSPSDPDRYEYPFPDDKNSELYRKYRERADSMDDVIIAGRLGEYRYYDMDQSIARAMMLLKKIMKG